MKAIKDFFVGLFSIASVLLLLIVFGNMVVRGLFGPGYSLIAEGDVNFWEKIGVEPRRQMLFRTNGEYAYVTPAEGGLRNDGLYKEGGCTGVFDLFGDLKIYTPQGTEVCYSVEFLDANTMRINWEQGGYRDDYLSGNWKRYKRAANYPPF